MCTTQSTPDPEHSLADKILNGANWSVNNTSAAIIVTETLGGRLVDQVALSSSGDDWAEIDWPATLRTTGHLSGGERRLLAIAASLATGEPVDLNDTLSGLDPHNSQIVLEALAHALGAVCPNNKSGGQR